MDIFLIDISSLTDKKDGKTHRRFSRSILKDILQKKYGITSSVKDDGGKPYLEPSEMKFSISHSNNIIAFALDKNMEVGFDIEYLRERNYSKIMKYYGKDREGISQTEFYQAWTLYEAEYKLGNDSNYSLSFSYKTYMCSLAVPDRIVGDITIYELKLDDIGRLNTVEGRVLDCDNILPEPKIRIK